MARRFVEDVIADINTQMMDNTTGNITPAIMRSSLIDMLDSSIDDEALIAGNVQQSITIGSTWTTLSDSVTGVVGSFWPNTEGGDLDFLKVDAPAGTITGTATPGFTYNAIAVINIDSGNGVEVQASIGLNGVQNDDYIATFEGNAGTNFKAYYVERFSLSAPANAVYSLMLRAPAGNTTVDVIARNLGVIIKPTRNP